MTRREFGVTSFLTDRRLGRPARRWSPAANNQSPRWRGERGDLQDVANQFYVAEGGIHGFDMFFALGSHSDPDRVVVALGAGLNGRAVGAGACCCSTSTTMSGRAGSATPSTLNGNLQGNSSSSSNLVFIYSPFAVVARRLSCLWLMAVGPRGRHAPVWAGHCSSVYGHCPGRVQGRTGRQGMEVLLFTTNRQSAEPAVYRVIDWPDPKKTAAAPVGAAV